MWCTPHACLEGIQHQCYSQRRYMLIYSLKHCLVFRPLSPVIWGIIVFHDIHLAVKYHSQCFRNLTILQWNNLMKDFTRASFSNIQNSVEYIIFNPVIYILSTRCQSRRVIHPFSSQFCVLSWRWEYWCHDTVEWYNPLLALETTIQYNTIQYNNETYIAPKPKNLY